MSLLSSRDYYDALAPEYAGIARARYAYLDAVDSLIIGSMHNRPHPRHLDVGCGDGRRTLRIATAVGSRPVLGIDESAGMLTHASERGLDVYHGTVLDFEGGPFDLVTCLWNTLGHVPATARQSTLARVAQLLSPGGLLFLDVNNRHNARAYGVRRVARNVLRDLNGAPCGDVVARAVSARGEISTGGHLFSPREVDRLVATVPELSITRRTYVDYASGRRARSRFHGQILYRMERAATSNGF